MILNDAICEEPIIYDEVDVNHTGKKEKYEKYKSDDYAPTKHEYIERFVLLKLSNKFITEIFERLIICVVCLMKRYISFSKGIFWLSVCLNS